MLGYLCKVVRANLEIGNLKVCHIKIDKPYWRYLCNVVRGNLNIGNLKVCHI